MRDPDNELAAEGDSVPAVASSAAAQPPASTTALTFTNNEPARLHHATGACQTELAADHWSLSVSTITRRSKIRNHWSTTNVQDHHGQEDVAVMHPVFHLGRH